MTSIIKVNNIQNSSGTAAMTIDGSSNVTFPQNATFNGTVTGASDLVLLANISNTNINATSFEWSMDYDDYDSFYINVMRIQGSSTSNTSLEIEFKFNGSYGGGQTNPYFIEGQAGAGGAGRNYNSNGDGELMFNNVPAKYWSGFIRCVNFRGLGNGIPTLIAELGGTTLANNNHGSFYMMTGLHTVNIHQITDLKINFGSGNVTVVKMDIYGLRRS